MAGTPTKTDNRQLKAADRKRQGHLSNAYQAGRKHRAGDDTALERQAFDGDTEAQQAWDAGHADEGRQRRTAPFRAVQRGAQRAAGSPPGQRTVSAASDGAGFLLGLAVWAVALSYLRGGMPAARGWIAAKFINQPYTAPLDDISGNASAPAAPAAQGGIPYYLARPGGTPPDQVAPLRPAAPGRAG